MPIRFFLSIILTIMFLAGCGSSDYSNQLEPLKVGNTWTYQITHYDSTGAVISIDTTTRAIKVDTVINEEKWYDMIASNMLNLGTNRPDGLWLWNTRYEKKPHLYLKYPVEAGDIWSWDDYFGGNTVAFEVIAVNDTIETPAGKFATISYKLTHTALLPGAHPVYCYAPGVGMVKLEDYRGTRGAERATVYLKSLHELISYDLK